jgi:hypothetical protein
MEITTGALRALIAHWDAWENANVYDADGHPDVYLLIDTESGRVMDDAHETAEPIVHDIKRMLTGHAREGE